MSNEDINMITEILLGITNLDEKKIKIKQYKFINILYN